MAEFIFYQYHALMVEKLILRNFQSHDSSELTFNPGVNVIVGATDSGKSAIIRALYMMVFNRPSGSDMRSWWKHDETVVSVQFNDATVERIKGKKELYRLGDQEFTAFKTNIPDEIEQAINMDVDNFQNQLDSPFLLSNTAGEVSSYFNRVAKIDKIDESLRNIQSWINDLTKRHRLVEEDLSSKQAELKTYSYLDTLEILVEELEDKEKRYNQLNRNVTGLTALLKQVEDIQVDISALSGYLDMESAVDIILSKFNELDRIDQRYDDLDATLQRLKTTAQQIDEKSAVLTMGKIVDDILTLFDSRSSVTTQENALAAQIKEINNTRDLLHTARVTLKRKQREFDEIFPDACPLCGHPKRI